MYNQNRNLTILRQAISEGNLFQDISDLSYIFLQLQLRYKTDLHERKSLIIFDDERIIIGTS